MVEKMLVALNKDHVLARKRRVASADLRDEQLVLYSRPDGKSALDEHVQAIAEKGGFDPNVAQKAEKLTAIIGLVAGGSGVERVSTFLLCIYASSVVVFPQGDLAYFSQIALAYPGTE